MTVFVARNFERDVLEVVLARAVMRIAFTLALSPRHEAR